MAAFTYVDCFVSINGVDRSSFVRKVTLNTEAAEQDRTTFSDAGWTALLAGRKSGSIAIEFNQDVAAAQIDSAMWPLTPMGGGTGVVAFEVRPTAAGVSTSNPKWTGNVLLKEWTPLDGGPGDLASVSVTWPTSGAITRATA